MVSHLPWASPQGLVFWQHSGLRIGMLFHGVWLPIEKNENCGARWRLPSKLAQCRFGCILLLEVVTGPAQVQGCGAADFVSLCRRDKTTTEEHSDATFCGYLWEMPHLVPQARLSSCPIFCSYSRLCFLILQSLWKECFFSVSVIAPPSFSSINIYWVSTKGQPLCYKRITEFR